MNADDTAGDLELDLLATLKTGLPANGRRDHEGRFVVDGDGHGRRYNRDAISLSV
jgi:hypothetical protein